MRDAIAMHMSAAMVTLGDAVAATSLSSVELLAWVNAGVLPALEPGPANIPMWPAEVLALINQVDAFLELDLPLDELRDLPLAAGLLPWRP